MGYLTLIEAAQYASSKTGQVMSPDALLRAGVHGVLRLSAPFGFGAMYNATRGENEDFRAGLLTIPPAHLLEIETEGRAKIEVAQSLDGQTVYFPRKERTRDHLRALVGDLDAFITGLSGATTKPPAQPGASKQAERIAAIVETVRALGYDPQNIPYGGKSIIERECLKSAKLFTPSTFKTAWQSARNAGRIEVENAETYRGQ